MRQVKKPEVRRAEIVDAAMDLFMVRGPEKTTVEAIVESMGVAKGCFYHHFKSKDDVFAACVEALAGRIADSFLAVLDDHSIPPRARLIAYLDYAYALPERTAAPDMFSLLHSDRFTDMHHRVVEQAAAKLRPSMCALLEEGVAAGEFRVRDPEFTAVAVLGALRELHEIYADRVDLDLAAHRDLLLDLLERMLGARLT